MRNFAKGNIVKVGSELYIVTKQYENKNYELISANHSNSSTSTVNSPPFIKKLREDISEDLLEYYDIRGEAYPLTYYYDVPNDHYIENVEFVAESMMQYVRKSLSKIFDGLELERTW